tara:strand:+ start:517 stop:975 length:459 start_codon:yes stop_codon:yes gene_type:complete
MRETKILSQESYKDLRQLLESISDSKEQTCYCMNLDKEALDHSGLRTALKSGQLDGVILYDNYKVSGYLKMTPPNDDEKNWQILCYRIREDNALMYFKVLLRAAIRRASSMGAKSIKFVDDWGCQSLTNRQNILSELGFLQNREENSWEIHL